MGMHRLQHEMEMERQRKEEALLNAPLLIEASNRLIQNLRDEIDTSAETIEELRRQIAAAHSWKSKIADHLVSGIVGALFGLLLGLFAIPK